MGSLGWGLGFGSLGYGFGFGSFGAYSCFGFYSGLAGFSYLGFGFYSFGSFGFCSFGSLGFGSVVLGFSISFASSFGLAVTGLFLISLFGSQSDSGIYKYFSKTYLTQLL